MCSRSLLNFYVVNLRKSYEQLSIARPPYVQKLALSFQCVMNAYLLQRRGVVILHEKVGASDSSRSSLTDCSSELPLNVRRRSSRLKRKRWLQRTQPRCLKSLNWRLQLQPCGKSANSAKPVHNRQQKPRKAGSPSSNKSLRYSAKSTCAALHRSVVDH